MAPSLVFFPLYRLFLSNLIFKHMSSYNLCVDNWHRHSSRSSLQIKILACFLSEMLRYYLSSTQLKQSSESSYPGPPATFFLELCRQCINLATWACNLGATLDKAWVRGPGEWPESKVFKLILYKVSEIWHFLSIDPAKDLTQALLFLSCVLTTVTSCTLTLTMQSCPTHIYSECCCKYPLLSLSLCPCLLALSTSRISWEEVALHRTLQG